MLRSDAGWTSGHTCWLEVSCIGAGRVDDASRDDGATELQPRLIADLKAEASELRKAQVARLQL